MSHYLACNAAETFASVAPAAFDLLTEEEEPCHPSRPITVISFRGTADPIVYYRAHESTPPTAILSGYSLDPIHFIGPVETRDKWAKLDGCTGSPEDKGGGCQTYTQCKAGVEVTLCTAEGGGHDPGDANVGWAMLKRHPMP
jgi:polyhydroxybutyrate depolymerase